MREHGEEESFLKFRYKFIKSKDNKISLKVEFTGRKDWRQPEIRDAEVSRRTKKPVISSTNVIVHACHHYEKQISESKKKSYPGFFSVRGLYFF